jgi:hypothetical protein
MAGPQEARVGHGMGRSAVSDLEQSGGTFADEGFGRVVAVVEQHLALLIGERERTTLAHGRVLHGMVAPQVLYAITGFDR